MYHVNPLSLPKVVAASTWAITIIVSYADCPLVMSDWPFLVTKQPQFDKTRRQHLSIYLFIYLSIYLSKYKYIYIDTHTYIYYNIHNHLYLYVYLHTHTTHTHTHVYVYIYHTHIYITLINHIQMTTILSLTMFD